MNFCRLKKHNTKNEVSMINQYQTMPIYIISYHILHHAPLCILCIKQSMLSVLCLFEE